RRREVGDSARADRSVHRAGPRPVEPNAQPRTPDAPPVVPVPGAGPRRAGPAAPSDGALASSFSRLIEQTSQAFLAIDFDGRWIRFTPAYVAMLGYPAEELRGMTVQDITPPAWKATTADAIERLRATGKAQRYEKEYVGRGGRLVQVEVVTDYFRDENDEACG